jgi:hypothetical protein
MMTTSLRGCEMAGRSIRALGWLQLIAVLGIWAAVLIPFFAKGETPPLRAVFILLVLLMPVFSLSLGKAVKEHKQWGRTVGIVYSSLLLFGFPVGTLMGAYILYYLVKKWDDQPAV